MSNCWLIVDKNNIVLRPMNPETCTRSNLCCVLFSLVCKIRHTQRVLISRCIVVSIFSSHGLLTYLNKNGIVHSIKAHDIYICWKKVLIKEGLFVDLKELKNRWKIWFVLSKKAFKCNSKHTYITYVHNFRKIIIDQIGRCIYPNYRKSLKNKAVLTCKMGDKLPFFGHGYLGISATFFDASLRTFCKAQQDHFIQ